MMRMTRSTALVLQALASGHRHGFDIVESTGVRGGTVYPVLRRLEERGLVEARWEDVEVARRQRRPPRKYYHLLPAARDALRVARERHPFGSARGPAGQHAGGEA